jgi:hypothetical protein
MKVASSYQVQQVNWQQVANKKQQRLEDAAKGRMLKELREDQQFEIYQAKGRRLELEQVAASRKINVKV